jgi:hypothetical protein
MRLLPFTLAALAGAVLVAGCLETKQDVTLNPDRSGKMRVELVMSDMPFAMMPQNEPPDPQVSAKRFAKSVLDGSKGVETWSDVTVERTEDNRNRFTGTAYFQDFTAMSLQAGKMQGVTIEATPDGGMLLHLEPQQQPGPKPGGRETDTPPPTESTPEPQIPEEEMQQRLAAERAKWQQMKPMMAMTIGKMKMEATFRLPGKLVEVEGFHQTPDGGVQFVFDGGKVLEVIDKLMADDAYVRENMQAGKGGMGQPPLGDEALKQLFGTSGPLVAKTQGPAEPQFDYAAEVQAAKAAYPAMIQRLGLDQVPESAPGPQMPPGFGLPGGRKGGAGEQ